MEIVKGIGAILLIIVVIVIKGAGETGDVGSSPTLVDKILLLPREP